MLRKLAAVVMLLTYIQEVSSLSARVLTVLCQWVLWFLSVPPGNCHKSILDFPITTLFSILSNL